MAHFAEIDGAGIVLRVVVVPEAQAHRGEAFLRDDLGLGGTWVQTSFTASIRRRFAGPGMRYDPARDAFILPQPFASWKLDKAGDWVAPVPRPAGDEWVWEEDKGWVQTGELARRS